MTAEAYAKFYRETYRDLIEWYTPGSSPAGEESQKRYAKKIIPLLEPFVGRCPEDLLDIGGAPGVCAKIVAGHFKVDWVVADPACTPEEPTPIHFLDISWEEFPVENHRNRLKYDLILCCQTVDHLLDLRGGLEKMRSLLTDDGVLWIDILDWLYLLRQRQSVEAIIKVDHPYNLNEVTFLLLLSEVGFEPVRIAYQGSHIGFVCKKAPPSPELLAAEGHKNPILANVRKKEAESKWLGR
jgi:SAM-dependent methyltransferase